MILEFDFLKVDEHFCMLFYCDQCQLSYLPPDSCRQSAIEIDIIALLLAISAYVNYNYIEDIAASAYYEMLDPTM